MSNFICGKAVGLEEEGSPGNPVPILGSDGIGFPFRAGRGQRSARARVVIGDLRRYLELSESLGGMNRPFPIITLQIEITGIYDRQSGLRIAGGSLEARQIILELGAVPFHFQG